MGWSELHQMARDRWHGAFPVLHAPEVGLTVDAVNARARREKFDRPHPNVLIVPGYPADHRTRLTAAQLHLGPSAAASDLSAAWLYGLVPRPPPRPHLLLPHARRVQPRHLTIHRSRWFEPQDRTIVDGISVVTPVFLPIAIAPRAGFETVLAFAIDARQRRQLVPDALAARLDAVGRVPGRATVEAVVAELRCDGSDSMFERMVRDRLRAEGFSPSSAPHALTTPGGRPVHLDIAFPTQLVAIECQGHLAHSSRAQLDRDARRDNAIALAGGWIVLKLTWDRFHTDWPAFRAELEAALACSPTLRGANPSR